MVELNEPINVWVFFEKTKITPYVFFWKKRRIKVDTINLIHTSKEGSRTFYHFAVSSGNNFYALKFDMGSLKWSIEGVEEDG